VIEQSEQPQQLPASNLNAVINETFQQIFKKYQTDIAYYIILMLDTISEEKLP